MTLILFRGPDIPIPPELLPWTQFTDWDPESTGEEDLLQGLGEGPGDPDSTGEKEDPLRWLGDGPGDSK